MSHVPLVSVVTLDLVTGRSALGPNQLRIHSTGHDLDATTCIVVCLLHLSCNLWLN